MERGEGIAGESRRLVSTAHSTASSTPLNTIAFTTQVEPKSSAKPARLRISTRRNPAPSRRGRRTALTNVNQGRRRAAPRAPPEEPDDPVRDVHRMDLSRPYGNGWSSVAGAGDASALGFQVVRQRWVGAGGLPGDQAKRRTVAAPRVDDTGGLPNTRGERLPANRSTNHGSR